MFRFIKKEGKKYISINSTMFPIDTFAEKNKVIEDVMSGKFIISNSEKNEIIKYIRTDKNGF